MTVQIKSAAASKINIAQLVGAAAMIGTLAGVDVPPEVQAQIVTGIGAITAVTTWVLRTWFTTSLTKASAERAGLY
jgi:hypothetical protein